MVLIQPPSSQLKGALKTDKGIMVKMDNLSCDLL